MNCSDFIERFSEYVDDRVSEPLRSEVEAHLAECGSCRRYLSVFERGCALLRSFPAVEVTQDFHPRLQHRIFHIEDAGALVGREGSAATAAITVGMALLLVLAAWAPVLVRSPDVELSPIVVTQPESRGLGLQIAPADELLGSPEALSDVDDLWRGALLFRYSPLAERAGRARVRRAGLD
jgi:anti-sigma factor RsiW